MSAYDPEPARVPNGPVGNGSPLPSDAAARREARLRALAGRRVMTDDPMVRPSPDEPAPGTVAADQALVRHLVAGYLAWGRTASFVPGERPSEDEARRVLDHFAAYARTALCASVYPEAARGE